MKRFIVALIVGLLVGYNWGFRDAAAGEPSMGKRILTKFGVDKVKADQDAADQRVRDAASP